MFKIFQAKIRIKYKIICKTKMLELTEQEGKAFEAERQNKNVKVQ